MDKSVLIVGNGSIGLEKKTGKGYINNRTGNFLLKLQRKNYDITYLEPITQFEQNNNLQNFNLNDNGLAFVGLNTARGHKKVKIISTVLKLINNHNLIYIFFPGTLGKFIAFLSIIFFKSFGIYLRGEVKLNYINKLILKKASFILTVSPYLKDLVFPFQNNVKCIKPMIDIKPADLFKKKYCYKPNLTILYVGNISKGKGILELLEVANFFEQSNQRVRFKVVGGGSLYSKLINDKISSNIIFTGQIADKEILLNEYRNADIFYFPSHTEGFPRVLFEAMSQSLPIFTTMVGGISGYMSSFENCIVIPVKSPIEQFEIIKNTLVKEDLLNSIAENSFQKIKKILNNWESHEELFEKHIMLNR